MHRRLRGALLGFGGFGVLAGGTGSSNNSWHSPTTPRRRRGRPAEDHEDVGRRSGRAEDDAGEEHAEPPARAARPTGRTRKTGRAACRRNGAATAATLAGMYGASKAPSSTRNVAVSHSTVGAIGVSKTQTDQPAIGRLACVARRALSAIHPPTGCRMR